LRAIVTTREAGMRWPRRRRSAWGAPTNDAGADVKSCGPGAPVLALNGWRCFPHRADDGGNRAGPRGDHV